MNKNKTNINNNIATNRKAFYEYDIFNKGQSGPYLILLVENVTNLEAGNFKCRRGLE